MITVATCLWRANASTNPLSGKYTELWVERLYRGARRQLTVPFRFVCFVDVPRVFKEPAIEQERLSSDAPGYGHFTEPYRLNEPMILVGLDTLFVSNCDELARWCLEGDRLAMPRDHRSYRLKDQGYPDQAINGVALVPAGFRRVWDEWQGENDMVHIRRYPWMAIEDRWPGTVLSYKMQLRRNDPDPLPKACRIVYFHGQPKQDSLQHLQWARENWQ